MCKRERTIGSREIGTDFDSWAAGESDSECVFVCGAAPITQQTTTKTKRENGSDEEKRERINVRLGRVREDKGSEGR